MASTNRRVLFVDGFAGPGEYVGGEPGSPIIAVDSLFGRKSFDGMDASISLMFIENNPKRATHLRGLLATRLVPEGLNATFEVRESEYAPTISKMLDSIEEGNEILRPRL